MLIKLLDEDGDGEIGRDEFAQAVRDGVLDELLLGQEVEASELSAGDASPRRRRNRNGDTSRPLPDPTPATEHIPYEKRQFLWNIFNSKWDVMACCGLAGQAFLPSPFPRLLVR